MFKNQLKRCGSLLLRSLIGLALGETPAAQAAHDAPRTAAVDAERTGDSCGDIIYVLYYRESATGIWYEWLVYTDLAGAQEQARKLEEAGGVETLIRTRPSN